MTAPDLRTLIPHSGRMALLDRVVETAPDALTAEVTVREDSLFLEGEGVGAWVGLEYMAQAAAALAGYQALRAGRAIRPGVLLGTRRYECNRALFPLGSTLRVTARQAASNADELSTYECQLTAEGIHAAATVTIFHGLSAESLLAGDGE